MRYVLTVCGATLALAGATGAGPVHTLALADRAPVSVVGTGFAPNARTHVSVTTAGRHLARVVRTSRTGRLRARWPLRSLPTCTLVVVVASGVNEHLVTRALPARGACGGPPGPLGPPVLGP